MQWYGSPSPSRPTRPTINDLLNPITPPQPKALQEPQTQSNIQIPLSLGGDPGLRLAPPSNYRRIAHPSQAPALPAKDAIRRAELVPPFTLKPADWNIDRDKYGSASGEQSTTHPGYGVLHGRAPASPLHDAQPSTLGVDNGGSPHTRQPGHSVPPTTDPLSRKYSVDFYPMRTSPTLTPHPAGRPNPISEHRSATYGQHLDLVPAVYEFSAPFAAPSHSQTMQDAIMNVAERCDDVHDASMAILSANGTQLQNSDRVSLRVLERSFRHDKSSVSPIVQRTPDHSEPADTIFVEHKSVKSTKKRSPHDEHGYSEALSSSSSSSSSHSMLVQSPLPQKVVKKARMDGPEGNTSVNGTLKVQKRATPKKRIDSVAKLAPQIQPNPPLTCLYSARQDQSRDQFDKRHVLRKKTRYEIRIPVPLNPGTLVHEPQFARCMSHRYKSDDFPRCVSCTRRWAGDTCRFQNIRYFSRDENKILQAFSFLAHHGHCPDKALSSLPNNWNIPLERPHIDRTLLTVAKALYPVLVQEKARHMILPHIIRRARETEVRATCDTCMTSLFTNSWMCRQCGREACEDCYNTLIELTARPVPSSAISDEEFKEQQAAYHTRRERHSRKSPFFLSCTKRIEHDVSSFSPVTRFDAAELDESLREMGQLIHKNPEDDIRNAIEEETNSQPRPRENFGTISESSMGTIAVEHGNTKPGGQRDSLSGPLPQTSLHIEISSNDVLRLPSNTQPIHFNAVREQNDVHILSDVSVDSLQAQSTDVIPSWVIKRYAADTLTEEEFEREWSSGHPLLVDGLQARFKLQWSPSYFTENYGQQNCLILECQVDSNKRITVGEFFSQFGKYEGRKDCWKLKDWPPSTDFHSTFPELYDDFNHITPAPSFSRRDGAFNIASHFPSGTVAPDLGPKMYNAFASNENPGTKGSTRLHMDMADAVNIMMHAERTPTGDEGSAAWDIFRVEDAEKIRAFLKTHFRDKVMHDPIHSQTFYLDPPLRKKLYDEFGVKSYRIYQRPGEAVFIPAGCAHQVCNLADCIKVACDFVSPDSVDRCEKLTKEFRDQNHATVWKEDVLQLRAMMWYAWMSCCRQRARLDIEMNHGPRVELATESNEDGNNNNWAMRKED